MIHAAFGVDSYSLPSLFPIVFMSTRLLVPLFHGRSDLRLHSPYVFF